MKRARCVPSRTRDAGDARVVCVSRLRDVAGAAINERRTRKRARRDERSLRQPKKQKTKSKQRSRNLNLNHLDVHLFASFALKTSEWACPAGRSIKRLDCERHLLFSSFILLLRFVSLVTQLIVSPSSFRDRAVACRVAAVSANLSDLSASHYVRHESLPLLLLRSNFFFVASIFPWAKTLTDPTARIGLFSLACLRAPFDFLFFNI